MIRLLFISALAFIACMASMVSNTSAVNYSSGTYGSCQYGSCSISLASESSISIDVTPLGGSTRCTVQSDEVTAITRSSTGYTVLINNGDTSTTLDGPGDAAIASVSGTEGSPVALTASTWGYRVDSVAGFGAGPTSPLSDASIPAHTFAATPSSASGGGVVRYTTVVDAEEIATPVWYGVCVDASKESGAYTDSVLYTAIIN